MQLPSLPPPLLLLPLLTLPAFAQCALKGPTPLPPAPPALTYLFTTTINVGKPLNPIPVIGGGERVEPLVPGTVDGPAFNGTINGGTAWPTIISNTTFNIAQLNIYGNTADKVPFFVSGEGVGTSEEQFVRLKVDIGGKYAGLAKAFVVGQLLPNAAGTVVTVHGFQVGK